MKATETLMSEHRMIERVLDVLESATDSLMEGKTLQLTVISEAIEFIREFADGYHHRKEETLLFPLMNRYGVAIHGGPLCAMLDEHKRAREFLKDLEYAAKRFEGGDPVSRMLLILNARGYIYLMRKHIEKEDQSLFPLADQTIPFREQQDLMTEFYLLEHAAGIKDVSAKLIAFDERVK